MNKETINRRAIVLWGAICGDVIGSSYEFHPTKNYNFNLFNRYSRFTDDTVCTIAVADALLHDLPFDEALQTWCRRYPRAGYGGLFRRWIGSTNPQPYNSFGNGSAMRVSPCGAFAETLEDALELAKESAEVTHNHPQGIKGARATAASIFLALNGQGDEIQDYIENSMGYDLSRKYEDIKPWYSFDATCQGSVPEAITAFLASNDYESTIRNAVSLGGDADTQAAIAGGIAAAYYSEIPDLILLTVKDILPADMLEVLEEFNTTTDK